MVARPGRSRPRAHRQNQLKLAGAAVIACTLVALQKVLILETAPRDHHMAHTGCKSFRVQEPPARRVSGQWTAYNGSLTFVTGGYAYRLPDYVDCPGVAKRRVSSFSLLSMLAAIRIRLSPANVRPFHSLPPSSARIACHQNAGGVRRHVRLQMTSGRRQSPGFANHGRYPLASAASKPPANGSVCAVMRFYADQLGDDARFTTHAALTSLTQQHRKDLTIILVHTDASNVSAVHNVLHRVNDRRVHLVTFKDLRNEPTVRTNHRAVWLATEKAISMCPASARWLLVTNGDNTYEPKFLDRLDDAYDIVAYDFYTRHRPAWARGECDWYSPRDGVSHGCLPNKLRLCETDLGAVVVNLHRWRGEGVRFSAHESDNGSEDGLTIESLVAQGWPHKRVMGASTNGCLFDHNPNYHSCLLLSNTTVWDDRAQQCVDTLFEIDAFRVVSRRHGPVERCLI